MRSMGDFYGMLFSRLWLEDITSMCQNDGKKESGLHREVYGIPQLMFSAKPVYVFGTLGCYDNILRHRVSKGPVTLKITRGKDAKLLICVLSLIDDGSINDDLTRGGG